MYTNKREGLPVNICGSRKGRVYKFRFCCVACCSHGLLFQHHHWVLGASIWPKFNLSNLAVHGSAAYHWQCSMVQGIGGDSSSLSLPILVSPWWAHSPHIPPVGRNGLWVSAAALSHLCEMQVLEPVTYNPGFYTLLRSLWAICLEPMTRHKVVSSNIMRYFHKYNLCYEFLDFAIYLF